MKKLAIFDLDGTLLDTLTDLVYCVNATMRHFGLPELTRERVSKIVGYGRTNLVMTASGVEKGPYLDELCKYYDGEYAEHGNDHTAPYPGVYDALLRIQEAGIPLAVFSNKPDDMTKLTIARHFPKIRFAAVFGGRPGVPMKPDPYTVFEICEMTGVAPRDTAYFGDSETDMKVAVASGCYPYGALWGFRGREVLIENGAKCLLVSAAEMADVVIQS